MTSLTISRLKFDLKLSLKLITALGLAATASGCATITRGTTESWNVQTNPPGATVSMSNGFHCDSTPCTIVMPRKNGFTATISKNGYKTATAQITSSMNGNGGSALAGNILVGGVIGIAVDANNGSLNDLTPNPLIITLLPDDAAIAPAASATPAPAAAAPGTPAPAAPKAPAPMTPVPAAPAAPVSGH